MTTPTQTLKLDDGDVARYSFSYRNSGGYKLHIQVQSPDDENSRYRLVVGPANKVERMVSLTQSGEVTIVAGQISWLRVLDIRDRLVEDGILKDGVSWSP